MQQVEEDEHALSRRQAPLDDRFESTERAAGNGDEAAGDDGVDLDDAVGPHSPAQICDHPDVRRVFACSVTSGVIAAESLRENPRRELTNGSAGAVRNSPYASELRDVARLERRRYS